MLNNQTQQIQLTLSLPEANQILEALGQMPYAQVYQLIGKIQQQAQNQLYPQANVEEKAIEPLTAIE
jgi:hypothetical protein